MHSAASELEDLESLYASAEKIMGEVVSLAQRIHEGTPSHILLSNTQQSRLAYILWMYPRTRDSYIALALKFYEVFFPHLVNGNKIDFEDFFVLPKMYDIQRMSAYLQNQLGWCPPSEIVEQQRKRRRDVKFGQYSKINKEERDSNVIVFVDESGKNDNYFVLSALSFTSNEDSAKLQDCFKGVKDTSEFKFSKIRPGNTANYKALIESFVNNLDHVRLFSVVLQNKELSQVSKYARTEQCASLLLQTLAFYHLQRGRSLNISICFDQDGPRLDALQQEQMRASFDKEMTSRYGSLCRVVSAEWRDSRNVPLLQLADLVAGALNNHYSKSEAETENSMAKQSIALGLLTSLGYNTATQLFDSKRMVVRLISNHELATS